MLPIAIRRTTFPRTAGPHIFTETTMLPTNAFNILDWSLREAPGAIIFRPTLKHALFRFLAGSLLLGLGLLGLYVIDAELRALRDRTRFTDAEVADLLADARADAKRLTAAGKGDEARRNLNRAEEFITTLAREKNASFAAMESLHRPIHFALYALAAVAAFFLVYLPLSPLWQRVRITRDGDTLVVRKNLLPRTRRISADAYRAPTLVPTPQGVHGDTDNSPLSYRWNVTLTDRTTSILFYLATSPSDTATPPAHATEFVRALQRLRLPY